ncbi:secondary thiamine-phosphate synthase enzyme YjbQ [Qipengyuania sp. MTN3-11]|uniref:secondary thiamine-phosphate synthase enzyme YjbQ n=1 Tax=Qipengyuania sp. MTN3-11 TaxID=3056557 RepID=UPI0036F1BC8C
MSHHTHILAVDTSGPGMIDLTARIAGWIERTGIRTGLLTALCRHTSASLTINENAASAVQRDLVAWLGRIAPESDIYEHDSEGPDDMPAHLKAALTGVSLAVPVEDGRMMLGTWQGIFLIEHRARPHRREVALHLSGE